MGLTREEYESLIGRTPFSELPPGSEAVELRIDELIANGFMKLCLVDGVLTVVAVESGLEQSS